MIIGDWGLGIGDCGLGIGPNPQSPIPNPRNFLNLNFIYKKKILKSLRYLKFKNVFFNVK